MKLQKQKTDYKRGYHKYVVVLSDDIVKQADFKEGDELVPEARKGEIRLKKGRNE